MQQQHLRENENTERRTDRFLELEMFTAPPMTANLSGLEVEYAVALIYSSEAGRREATLTVDAGQGTQDLGFRAEVPILFTVKPAIAVKLSVLDHDGTPTTGRFQFVDRQGHVFPPQAKRLAPDLFFQKHIYRAHGETVLLPPGELTMFYGRGPEYRWKERPVTIPGAAGDGAGRATPEIAVRLERWIDPAAHGFYSGDHHMHASGCAHYTSPTEGVDPADMFRQVKGEALNVGSVLTWGPGFDHQQQFFAPAADRRSEPLTQMKYDIEVSGFRLPGARSRRPAEPEGTDLSGRHGKPGLADLDAAGAALGESAGWRRRLCALGQRAADRCRGRDRTPARAARRQPGRPALGGGSGTWPPSRGVCRDRRGPQRPPLGRGAAGQPRPRRGPAAQPRDSRAEQRRRAGDLRHGSARRRATSSARWTPIASANGTPGITC